MGTMKRLQLGLGAGLWMAAAWGDQTDDRPCERSVYPDFLQLPPAAAIENPPVADPTGVGTRWNRLIQTALRPNPRDFTWYSEYQTWVCRFQQSDQVVWHIFPKEANAPAIAGTLVKGRLLVAPIADLVRQGMALSDARPFSVADLELAEKTRHPQAPE
jgi:hypothetical protein